MKNGFDLENNFCVCTGNAGWTVLYRMVVLNKILAFISTELLRKSWAIWVADMFEKEQNCCNHTETWCKSFFIMAEKVPHVKGFSIQSFNTTVPERVLWELCFWDTLAFPSHTFSSSLLPSSSSISVNSQYLFFLIFEFQKAKLYPEPFLTQKIQTRAGSVRESKGLGSSLTLRFVQMMCRTECSKCISACKAEITTPLSFYLFISISSRLFSARRSFFSYFFRFGNYWICSGPRTISSYRWCPWLMPWVRDSEKHLRKTLQEKSRFFVKDRKKHCCLLSRSQV